MPSYSAGIFVLVAFAAAMLPLGLLAAWVVWNRRNDERRSPLSREVYNLPGEQAGREAEKLMEAASERLLFITLIGPTVLAAWAFQKLDPRLIQFGWTEGIILLFVVVASFLAARSGIRLLKERRHYVDGLAAERATAQELTPLIAKGCAIYHDVPAEKFNLDHIVISSHAVFMVETKSRRKPAERGSANAQVTYDGAGLVFPNWRETKMLDQARAQARWLAEYLHRKTGEGVRVEPVLALPGWYVKKSGPASDVHVINPRMHNFMADRSGLLFSDAQRRRIMTAIEERYPRGD